MSHDMPSIDTSGIESLKKLREDQDIVKSRLEKMISIKESVSEEVYTKVYGEYSDKMDALAAEAEPLKSKIRSQYAVLKKIMDELTGELTAINLEKEEMEFRNTLGEFEEDAFKEQMKEWEVRHTSKQAEMDEADEMKAMFLDVFDSEEDLEGGQELTTMPVDVARRLEDRDMIVEEEPDVELVPGGLDSESAGDDPVDDTDEILASAENEEQDDDMIDDLDDEDLVDDLGGELSGEFPDDLEEQLGDFDDEDLMEDSTSDTQEVEPPPPPLPNLNTIDPSSEPNTDDDTIRSEHVAMPPVPDGEDATVIMQKPDLAPPGDGDDPDGTMIIANPKIICMNHAAEGQVIVLGMGTTSLGRSPDNDIHITEDRISRKHSQIAFGPGGYAIYDLNSENGTYVNGNRVREHFLQDGDIIMVGTYKYLYRDH